MKVKELISHLQSFDQELEVKVVHDYTNSLYKEDVMVIDNKFSLELEKSIACEKYLAILN